MRKILAIIMAFTSLSAPSASAAWEFDEKVIYGEDGKPIVLIQDDYVTVYKDKIEVNYVRYMENPRELTRSYYPVQIKYFDLNGTKISGDYSQTINGYYPENDTDYGESENLRVYTENDVSYVCDAVGNRLCQLAYKADNISDFYCGTAIVDGIWYYYEDNKWNGEWICDENGNNIFEKKYNYINYIDNNEFLVVDTGNQLKILRAKGIIGEALNTDVKISINGYKIPCYSAYGYAAIKAEDLRYFGFDVKWDEARRMLYVSRNPEYYDITAGEFPQVGVPGTHYADIYGTDINVEYEGRRIASYCIDGETLIKAEDLAKEGIRFNYNNSQRMLYMTVDGLETR